MAHYPSFTAAELERALYVDPNSPGAIFETLRRFGDVADDNDSGEAEREDLLARVDRLEAELRDADVAHERIEAERDKLLDRVDELEKAQAA